MLTSLLPLLSLTTLALAQENVLGVYVFHRHGDRTSKSYSPVSLTDLGYQNVYTSGQYYRSRYIASGAQLPISGISPNTVKLSQLSVSSPSDNVLQNSATGFLQGLYPPVGAPADQQTLANSTVITAPMNGYQLIPVAITSTNSGSESNGWLQAATGCLNAVSSSNQYFYSPEYTTLLNSTASFYQNILPVVNTTFNATADTYKNAYTIFDYLNVARIHNASIPSGGLLTDDTFYQIRTLSDQHEFNLAYNASSPVRSIAGMQLAAQVVQFLNSSLTSKGASNQFGIQFGAYATFQAIFGLMNMTTSTSALSTQDAMDFWGIPDYASTMIWELYSNSTGAAGNGSVVASAYTNTDDLNVRFLFHNGTTSNISEPTQFPMFGSTSVSMPWNTFVSKMNAISVGTTEQWCNMCGASSSNVCAAYNSTSSSGSTGSTTTTTQKSGGLSNVVCGVIGAMVTLAVILGLEAIFMLVGGYRLINRKRLASDVTNVNVSTKA